MEERFYGLNRRSLQSLAFQIADLNGIRTRFNKTTKLAGKEGLAAFLVRNPSMGLRQPEATLLARAAGFNLNV